MEINGEEIVTVTRASGWVELYAVAKKAAKGGLTLRPLRWTDGPSRDFNGTGWKLTTVDCLHIGDVICTDEDALNAVKGPLIPPDTRETYMDWSAVGREAVLVVDLSVYPGGLDRCEIRVAQRMWDESTAFDETLCNGGDETLVWRPEE